MKGLGEHGDPFKNMPELMQKPLADKINKFCKMDVCFCAQMCMPCKHHHVFLEKQEMVGRTTQIRQIKNP